MLRTSPGLQARCDAGYANPESTMGDPLTSLQVILSELPRWLVRVCSVSACSTRKSRAF